MIRVHLADDHEMFRELLRLAMRSQADLEIVGESGDGRATLDAVARLRPDVVLLDYKMPQTPSFTGLVKNIRENSAQTRVIVVSGYADPEVAVQAAEGGASGYVLKETRLHGVFDAVRAVYGGGIWVDPALPRSVFDRFQSIATSTAEQSDGLVELTRRERQVLACVAQGGTNRDIADQLAVSEQTVKTHLTRIFAKLGVENRVEAALAFYGRGTEASSPAA